MRLSKEEAISLVLKLSKDRKTSGKIKLNKLLARLNRFMIPLEIDFSLNKFGSYSGDVELDQSAYYTVSEYEYMGKMQKGLQLTSEGGRLATEVMEKKLSKILDQRSIQDLQAKIFELSTYTADRIADDEHKELLVDQDDREKLIQRINTVHIDMFDLMEEVKKLSDESMADIHFAALIEYCFHLTKYLKEKPFKRIGEDYDYDAHMENYYFLYCLEKEVIPFINQQLKLAVKDDISINRYYQYFVNVARHKYPFSLDNPHLNELIS